MRSRFPPKRDFFVKTTKQKQKTAGLWVMMSWKIRFTDKAGRDLRNIMEYVSYALLDPETAKNLLRRIMGEIETLDTMPLRYPLFHEEPWRGRGLRFFAVGK